MKHILYYLQIYILICIFQPAKAQNMENFVDSMRYTTEGVAMYNNIFANHTGDISGTRDRIDAAENYVFQYYTRMFYELYDTAYISIYDTLGLGMCLNGKFELSDVDDPYLFGFRIYSGLRSGRPQCTHDHSLLANLPLPGSSFPEDQIEFPFNLNPNDNASLTTSEQITKGNFDRIELFMPGSGNDPYIPSIKRNPPSGNRSIRLNRDRQYFHTNTMERVFIPQEADSIYSFSYALVMEDPGHMLSTQPYFTVVALDEFDNVIDGICVISDPNNPELGAISIGSNDFTYKNWTCVEFNLSEYEGQSVRIRYTAAACGQYGHWGYAYIADICEPCGNLPEIDLGQYQYICPKEFPLEFCGTINFNDTLFSLDSLRMEVRIGSTVYMVLTPSSYDPDTGEFCFEITEMQYESLAMLGFDVYVKGYLTNLETEEEVVIESLSSTPNFPGNVNNDIIKDCCPIFELDTVSYCCTSDTILYCGNVSFPEGCNDTISVVDIIISHGDSIHLSIPVEVDDNGDFCYILTDSLLATLPNLCFNVHVEVTYLWPGGDSIWITACSMPFGDDSCDCDLDNDCCPEANLTLAPNKFLCLFGNNYSPHVYYLEANILKNTFPAGFAFCGLTPSFPGVDIDFESVVDNPVSIQFMGSVHVSDTTVILTDPITGGRYVMGTIELCDGEIICEYPIRLNFTMGQETMCNNMSGIMCDNFYINTLPYSPPSNYPVTTGGNAWLPIKVILPYGNKISKGDTCVIDEYTIRITGIDGGFFPINTTLSTETIY